MAAVVFPGDRQIPNADHFPETLTPFPEPTELVYSRPPEPSDRRSDSPPHKLRPIRRSLVDCDRSRLVDCWDTNSVENEPGVFSDLSLSPDNSEEPASSEKKRKRESKSNFNQFLENMVTKVIDKQEQMHKQLMSTIENMENERIRREESWRRVETERFEKDETLRAQEMSRSLALISLLQNLLGEEIHTPDPISQLQKAANWVNSETRVDARFEDPGNRRWPDAEVRALITLRSSLDHKFRNMSSKGSVWKEISEGMSGLGYDRTAKKCKEKWENMNKYFRRLVDNGKSRSNDKTCSYFDELDLLYRTGVIDLGIGVGDEEAESRRDFESLEVESGKIGMNPP